MSVKGKILMSVNPLIAKITESQLRNDIPDFRAGDSVRVHARIVEGSRERIQIFEGVVIKRRGEGISETYTVRKISNGIGVNTNTVTNLTNSICFTDTFTTTLNNYTFKNLDTFT